MSATESDTIRVLVSHEDDGWAAQCIEYDISAYASDFDTVMKRLEITVNAECEYTTRTHGKAFANIAAAPLEFAEKFDALSESLQRENMELRIAA